MSKFYLIFIVFILIFTKQSSAKRKSASATPHRSRGCKITIPTDIPENEPVYLNQYQNRYTFFTPTGKDNYIKTSNSLTIFCPGNKNHLSTGNSNQSQLLCNTNFKFEIDTIEYEFNRINCTKETVGDINLTNRTCSFDQGRIIEIGFKLSQNKFITLFEVCYNSDSGSVIYSTHKINGKAIRFNVKEPERREFKAYGIPKTIKPQISYKKAKQIERFNDIFGSNQKYITSTSYLSRGHLTPDADFIFTTAQFATYFYINVAPQFQIINAGNWLKIEKLTRNISNLYSQELLIYTGTYQQLSLTNNQGELIPLYLEDDNKIIVPKWLWKIVIHENMNAGIVFITLNNPFAERNDVNEFCENVCEKAGLINRDFDNLNKGYTFCCELNEFKQIVQFLPQNLTVNSLLDCTYVK